MAVEALVVGLLGSALGLLAGLGLSIALTTVLSRLGSGIPVTGQSLSTSSVLITMGVGVGVTMLAAMLPARRAGRVAPVEAMRGQFASPSTDHILRLVIGFFVAALGAVATMTGAVSGSSVWLGLGFLGVAATVVIMSPLLAPVVFGVIGPVLARPFGAIGRMAQGNASRNPRRTAATALSLALGLALVTLFAVIGASAKASLTQVANAGMTWDYVISGPQGMPIPGGVVAAVQDVDGVDEVSTLTMAPALVAGEATYGLAMSGTLDKVVELDMVDGEAMLSDTTLLATQDAADEFGWRVGNVVTLESPGQGEVELTVGGIYDSEYFAPWLINDSSLQSLVAPQNQMTLQTFVIGERGADMSQLQTDLDEAVAPFKTATVDDRAAFTAALTQQVDIMLGVLTACSGWPSSSRSWASSTPWALGGGATPGDRDAAGRGDAALAGPQGDLRGVGADLGLRGVDRTRSRAGLRLSVHPDPGRRRAEDHGHAVGPVGAVPGDRCRGRRARRAVARAPGCQDPTAGGHLGRVTVRP